MEDYDMDEAPPSPSEVLYSTENRHAIFYPAVQTLVNALGGYEDVESPSNPGNFETVYRPGDSILSVLKDLKKLWRKDDEDDERTVARCMYRAGLMKELVAVLCECAERGDWGRKVALVACDLIAALTWPIDVAQELKEMEDEGSVVTDYASLLRAQMEYKALFLKSVKPLECLLYLMVPCLAKPRKDEKDQRIVSLGLHIIRNLLAIRDASSSGTTLGEQEEFTHLQSALISYLDKLTYLQLFLTLAGAADKTDLNALNAIVLDILYLIFRGIKASNLAQDQQRAPISSLTNLLEVEFRQKSLAKTTFTRHSRFGTTITARSGEQRVILHEGKAVSQEPGKILDNIKRKRSTAVKKVDDLTIAANLSHEAMIILQSFTHSFLEVAFNTFFDSILRDIRMERVKIRPSDNIRVFYLSYFFIEYLLFTRKKAAEETARSRNSTSVQERKTKELPLGAVAQMAEMDTLRWLFGRLRSCWDDKPRAWVELQACIDCFTQILLLIDEMAASKDEEEVEVAEILQHQLYYNYDILDSSLSVVREYKNQSIAYLDSIINFAYVLLRMLERYSKTKAFMFIRKRKNTHKKRKAEQVAARTHDDQEERKRIPEEYGDEEDEVLVEKQEGPSYEEHAFTFQSFEKRFSTEAVANTLLVYLERFLELDSEQLKRLVGLMHRQVIKTHAEALYFKVSAMIVFQRILEKQSALPNGPSSRDLVTLVTYVLRKIFKRVNVDRFTIVEVFSNKSRSSWRSMDGGDSDDGMGGQKVRIQENIGPAELQFIRKHNLSWSQQVGIVFTILCDDGLNHLIKWIVEVLEQVHAARQEVVLMTDGGFEEGNGPQNGVVSDEAIRKFTQFDLEGDTEEQRQAIASNPHFRLFLNLLSFTHLHPPNSLDFDEELSPSELNIAQQNALNSFLFPQNVLPKEIESVIESLKQYMDNPPNVGEEPKRLLRRNPRGRPRQARSLSPASDYDSQTEGAILDTNNPSAGFNPTTKRHQSRHERSDRRKGRQNKTGRKGRAKKDVETQNFKSAAFIEDSDDEDEEQMRLFFEKEEKLRREMQEEAIARGQVLPDVDGFNRKTKRKKSSYSVDQPSSSEENDIAYPSSRAELEEGSTTTVIATEKVAQAERRKAQLAEIRRMMVESENEDSPDSESDYGQDAHLPSPSAAKRPTMSLNFEDDGREGLLSNTRDYEDEGEDDSQIDGQAGNRRRKRKIPDSDDE
ncbi:hypothetical protein L204_103220 [Cryptococcus depauperatus]